VKPTGARPRDPVPGGDLTEVLRQLEVSESSWNRWRNQYGGMKANEAKRLRELESENARLKKLLAEAELDKSMLKESTNQHSHEGWTSQRGPVTRTGQAPTSVARRRAAASRRSRSSW
jgi:transposase-like protein